MAEFSSSMAFWYCSAFGALPCQPAWFSIKLTPLPLVVLAIIGKGLAGAFPGGVKRRLKALKVVAVGNSDLAAKGAQLFVDGLEARHLLDVAVYL